MTAGRDDRAQRWVRERWPAIRARGLAHFLLFKGLLIWGGIMFLLIALLTTHHFGTDHPRLPMLLGIGAVLCAIGGLFWAGLTWWLNERIFRSLTSDQHP